ncbi:MULTISPECIES: nitroreductase family deazaflavin-dependent oxidoreductase [unclassified Streptomyces]|uniref:nitroreductase family deazaflavin-dependent oxidoreductase n=1 Tax=unclassified Streptomyces TaxID=2593676 RepID=UPI0009355AB8|nr:nitroreductase family deazaflavin-dependent oxidoreductase [Streptomyces sp. NBRC 110465]WHI98143.1 nitroreductase family deazaflavin-dependent oxidoreductase [Streptomyces sundarbansensis]
MAPVQFDPAPTAPAEDAPGAYNLQVIQQFRENGGKVGGPFEGAALILLTTRGAKSGLARTVPTLYFRQADGSLLIFGSNGGADTHPAWFHNIKVNPQVTVEAGDETYSAVAREVPSGEQRDRLFAEASAEVQAFADYQAGTEREIPLVLLSRRD